jgi:hypothetical protein
MKPMTLKMRALVFVLSVLVIAGCATTPKINWQARVGIYTYDQSVKDYGPPDKFAKLSDGTTVAEWLLRRGEIIETPEPAFYPPGYFGPIWQGYSTTSFPARFLRLTFGADGKLLAEKEFSK